jgi:hypothetical protein
MFDGRAPADRWLDEHASREAASKTSVGPSDLDRDSGRRMDWEAKRTGRRIARSIDKDRRLLGLATRYWAV